MNTRGLIRALAADTTPGPRLGALLSAVVAAAAFAAAMPFLAGMGLRPDLAAALTRGAVLIKNAFPVLLALTAAAAVLRLARPEVGLGRGALALLAAGPALVAAAVLREALTLPVAAWPAAILDPSLWTCLAFIPLMGAPILAASLLVLRLGASTRPALSGAAAGLLSGGAAAAIYAFYCTQDSPFFYGLWYGLGIAALAATGAFAGARLLRW